VRSREQRLDLPPRPASAAEARRFVSRAVGPLTSPEHCEVAVLLASELVTNALLYAEGRIRVGVDTDAGRVRVWVRDRSTTPARPKHVGVEATSGRGLALVERLSSAWGVEQVPDEGKEVWFELPADRA
jgi:anti-sigma regulatory factor (Ser/Thr protein kinase)